MNTEEQSPKTVVPGNSGSFRNLGIAPALLSTLDSLSYTVPTPIQSKAIMPGIEGKDIVGVAQTGTGKTLAFGVPLLQRLLSIKGKGLILVPTRELALQVAETLQKIAPSVGIRGTILIGGTSMQPQVTALRQNPRIIIATPGRLIDHMERKTLTLRDVGILILDEADRMLDMGFMPQLRRILTEVPTDRQTMLFSATLSPEILSIATKAMKLPLQIEVAPQGTVADKVTQELFVVRREDKPRLLQKILSDYHGSTLIFTKTKHGASRIARLLSSIGHASAEIHSNRSLGQRTAALEGFKNGRFRVLVATDIVARGIDVKGVELVINYDLPAQSADYVHRIGRTGRAGAEGHAISFVAPDEKRLIYSIERLIRKPIRTSVLPELPAPVPGAMSFGPEENRGRRPQYRSGGSRSSSGRSFSSGSGSPRRSFGGSSSRGSSSRRSSFRRDY